MAENDLKRRKGTTLEEVARETQELFKDDPIRHAYVSPGDPEFQELTKTFKEGGGLARRIRSSFEVTKEDEEEFKKSPAGICFELYQTANKREEETYSLLLQAFHELGERASKELEQHQRLKERTSKGGKASAIQKKEDTAQLVQRLIKLLPELQNDPRNKKKEALDKTIADRFSVSERTARRLRKKAEEAISKNTLAKR